LYFQVLDPTKNPLEGQLEEEDSSDEDEEEEEDASSGEEGEEEEDEEEEEESDIDEEYLGNESNTDKLRQVVNQALGMNGNITDAVSYSIPREGKYCFIIEGPRGKKD
jgi:AAA ATPase containing von Willebrand factor type A (vWA) domain